MIIKVLSLGEIVGKAGIYCVRHHLDEIKKEYDIDFTIANAQGVTGGFGLGKNHAIQMLKSGIDVLTGGEKIFYKHDLVNSLNSLTSVLRPFNLPPSTPGKSIYNKCIKDNVHISVINMMGTSIYQRMHCQNPFLASDYILSKMDKNNIVLVQFFCMTTAESASFGHYLDGKVSGVLATGTKVQTADEQILRNGTGYITDIGRVGSLGGPGGFDSKNEIEQYLTGVPLQSEDCFEDLAIQAVILSIDTETKKTVDIQSITKRYTVNGS